MHNRDELHSEPGLHITGDVFDDGGNRVSGGEQRVYNNAKVFNLEVSLVQGFEGASIIKVVVERHGKVRVSDGSDEGGMFNWEREQVELVAVDRDINAQDRRDFYSRWR